MSVSSEPEVDALLAVERRSREVRDALRGARKLAPDTSSPVAIRAYGTGKDGHEALAIGLACALSADTSSAGCFEGAVWRAVTHGGESTSTGAIAGVIVGAMVGVRGISEGYRYVQVASSIESLAADLASTA